MAIYIKIDNTIAKIENDNWECKEKNLLKVLKLFIWDDIEGYSPNEDLTVAKMAIEGIGGKIIKKTNQPTFIKDRIY